MNIRVKILHQVLINDLIMQPDAISKLHILFLNYKIYKIQLSLQGHILIPLEE